MAAHQRHTHRRVTLRQGVLRRARPVDGHVLTRTACDMLPPLRARGHLDPPALAQMLPRTGAQQRPRNAPISATLLRTQRGPKLPDDTNFLHRRARRR